MYITRHSNVTERTVLDSLWELYDVCYAPLAAQDVTREQLYRHEFDSVMADPTYRSTVLRETDGRPIAMAVSATDIGVTRYLSRGFFEKHYPDRMAAGQVHYVMWIVVHPDYRGGRALFELSRAGLSQEAEDGALLVFDLPESNQPNEGGGGAELLHRMAQMVGEVSLTSFGVNRYYALDFAPAESPTPAPATEAESEVTADAGRVSR